MATKPLPSPEVLRQLLRYEPDTGKLFWKERVGTSAETRRWNSRYSLTEAFTTVGTKGYLLGKIHAIGLRAHHVAWAIYHGEWADSIIDHIDGDPANNRICNLRLATRHENGCNRRSARGSSSRFLGVNYNKRLELWHARITPETGKTLHLGFFSTEKAAADAYDDAARKHHGQFARLNSP